MTYILLQGVPILSVNIFRGDEGPIGEQCFFLFRF